MPHTLPAFPNYQKNQFIKKIKIKQMVVLKQKAVGEIQRLRRRQTYCPTQRPNTHLGFRVTVSFAITKPNVVGNDPKHDILELEHQF